MCDPGVIVAGAGPAGMTLALLLIRSGVRVTVIEQATTFAREFRGEVLQPGVTRILADIGLRERVLALGAGAPVGIDIQYGHTVKRFERPVVDETTSGNGLAIVPQQQFLEVLAAEFTAHAGAELVMGCAVRELVRDARGVHGVRAHMRDGKRLDVRGRIVVACDGRFSVVRKIAGIDLHEKTVPFDLVWFSTPIPEHLAYRIYLRVTGNDVFGAFPTRTNRMQIGWLIRKGEYARMRTRPFAQILEFIATRVPAELQEMVRRTVSGWSDLALLPAVSQMALQWTQPGLLLLGDAAHPMSPAGAQGINVAMYDAVVAARRLVPALSDDGRSLDDAARAIERERRPAVVATQQAQNLLLDAVSALSPRVAVQLAMIALNPASRLRFRPRPVQRFVDRLRYGYPEVRANHGPWQRG